jgi:hypothetical protein
MTGHEIGCLRWRWKPASETYHAFVGALSICGRARFSETIMPMCSPESIPLDHIWTCGTCLYRLASPPPSE